MIALEVHLRLEVQRELMARQCAAQIHLQIAALQCSVIHFRGQKLHSSAATGPKVSLRTEASKWRPKIFNVY
ncbi:hypothetical protein GCM10022278_15750 [Allohahella marinimesophila]|uniref:Uncharacterized protein n=1 Tax=Allohahella marinimesophila TaxID=1054972 RepID=A0ABP7P1G4_9GAMM